MVSGQIIPDRNRSPGKYYHAAKVPIDAKIPRSFIHRYLAGISCSHQAPVPSWNGSDRFTFQERRLKNVSCATQSGTFFHNFSLNWFKTVTEVPSAEGRGNISLLITIKAHKLLHSSLHDDRADHIVSPSLGNGPMTYFYLLKAKFEVVLCTTQLESSTVLS
jgi:hypothetical protein